MTGAATGPAAPRRPSAAEPAADLGRQVLVECQRVLSQNWRTGTLDGRSFAYTAPSPGPYPWQWYWDSCLTAVAWRRFDAARSRAELESLLGAAEPDGFIGHTIFWDGKPVPFPRRLFYNFVHNDDFMTATIQPPLLAWAWRIAVGDPRAEPRIAAHHDAVAARRDLDGDGLLWIIQPDESGLDASPAFDAAWGWRADGLPGFPLLVRRNRRLGFDMRRVREKGGPLLCSVLVNVLHGLSQLSLGRPSITPVLVEKLYHPERGVFAHREWPSRKKHPHLTWAALSPLALPDLPEAIGRRMIDEHLLDPEEFWLPVPPPSVAANDRAYSTKDTFLGLRRYWRGPTWVNSAWLVWLGLVRLGYTEQARELAVRLTAAVAREGLREYYNPRTGAGMGASDFAWSALASELVDPDPRAGGSYLQD